MQKKLTLSNFKVNTPNSCEQLIFGLNNSAIVSLADSAGNITFASEKFSELTGYLQEELIGRNHHIVSSGYHSKEFFINMWKMISTGKTWQGEICNRKKTGEIYWVNTAITTSLDELGNRKYMSILFDITEQKNISLKLDESNRLWQFATESAGDGVWDWDIEKGDIYLSENFTKSLGYESHELVKIEDWLNLVHPDDRTLVMDSIDNEILGIGTYDNEHRILCKDKSYRWVQTRGMVVSREFSAPVKRMVGIYSDLSRIKQAEQKVTYSAKLASLGEMSAGMAHEINNPLSIISASATLLPRLINNPEKLEATIINIVKATERISKIVKGLKKFSRTSEVLSFKNYSLANIATEAITLAESKAKLYNTPVSIEIKSNSEIFCDEIEIEQVLINLISNAIDAIKEKEEKWVKIEIFDKENNVVIRIMDSGPGIPPEVRAKIFDPFFTTKKIGEGTGLGLSITRGILDAHKAKIQIIDDIPNTCFEIQFSKYSALNDKV